MTAQTQSRVASQRGDAPLISLLAPPQKGNTKLFAGALVVSDAGYAAPGRAALGLIAMGVARKDTDATGLADGAITADIERGAFPFNNSAGVDQITQADLHKDCFIADDNTVAKTDGYGTRSKAGRIVEVTSSAIIVEVGAVGHGAKAQPAQILTFGMDLASIPAGNYVSHVMPFACRVKKVDVRVIKPATTAAKAATLTAKKGAAALTGGVVGLTSANCTPAGAEVAGSAITLDANSEFAAGDTLNIVGSAITAFVEGTAELLVHVEQVG
jgi:hypothetical protein